MVQVGERELLEKLREVDRLPDSDRATLNAVMDLLILKGKFRRLASDG